jgi:hypothetical protein
MLYLRLNGASVCVLLMRVNVKVLAKAFELIFATFKVRGMTLLPSSVH